MTKKKKRKVGSGSRQKELWADPNYRQKMKEAAKKSWEGNEARRVVLSAKLKAHKRTEEHSRHISEALKAREQPSPFKGQYAETSEMIAKKTEKVRLYYKNHPEARKAISQRKKGKGGVSFARFGYDGPNGRHIFKSSYELVFVSWLDFKGYAWTYEPKKFFVGEGVWEGTSYKPDFYLPEKNLYCEVKGWYEVVKIIRMKRFRELYPDVKLKLFWNKEIKQIGSKLKKLGLYPDLKAARIQAPVIASDLSGNHKCQCSADCMAAVKTPGKLYARGHSPVSHSDERNIKARLAIKKSKVAEA